MKKVLLLGAVLSALFISAHRPPPTFRSVKPFAAFGELPLRAITPKGWLRQYLVNQRDGLTGHLECAQYPFNKVWWGSPVVTGNTSVSHWWPYEQTGYWLDGMIRTGYLLNDSFLIEKARAQLDYVLAHPDSSGYLGPAFMKPSTDGDRWTHAVMFRAMQAYYSATGDRSILTALRNHYAARFPHYGERESVNIETVLWLYGQTADTSLLGFARKIYAGFLTHNPTSQVLPAKYLSDEPSECHGVTYNELAKIGAILYMYTGNEEYLKPSIAAYDKIDKYHMLVNGVNVSSEHMHTPPGATQVNEVCDIADYSWSCGYLLMATGNGSYADHIEKAIFNAAPGSVTSDFKALQYFTAPNQMILSNHSSLSTMDAGGKGMTYRPNPITECCPGNVNRIMPNFVTRLWLDDGRYGLVAALYAPSSVHARVGEEQREVDIEEITDYPFSGKVTLAFSMHEATTFPLTFRIPGWCRSASARLNGEPLDRELKAGSFVTVSRKFADRDTLQIEFPQEIRMSRWPESGIALERGPLVYSLRIDETWKVDTADARSTKEFPAYEVFPASDWNYGLSVTKENLQDAITVREHPVNVNPWSSANAPVELIVPARQLKGWVINNAKFVPREKWNPVKKDGKVVWLKEGTEQIPGTYQLTPVLPDPSALPAMASGNITHVTLVPYGCARLRVTIFPLLKE